MKYRYSIKFGGQSGQGINVLGKFLSKGLKNSGYQTFAYREYPSTIKGGYASFQIEFSSGEILSSSMKTNILVSMCPKALEEYIFSVSKNGLIIHSVEGYIPSRKASRYIKEKNINILYVDVLDITKEQKASIIMGNVVLLGCVWQILNCDIKILEKVVVDFFSKKKGVDIAAEKRCLRAGYKLNELESLKNILLPKTKSRNWSKSKILSGNDALALGAIAAGCRAYYAYPMTPATSILETLGNTFLKTGMLVKQAESEITAVQMAMGSMYMGARAFTATSGGGFDLMSESISLSGMTEIPLVIVLGQRAGSATGVPTWSGASDLNTALYAGHGEYPKCVLCASDALDSYELIQEAFNISEIYQLPVILLTEKQIAESIFNISKLPTPKKIKRGITQNGTTRYLITKSGISPRWLPKVRKNTYLTNSDEHTQQGISTEKEIDIVSMSDKRLRKLASLKKGIPNPKYYGPLIPSILFVGIGSTKNAVLDAMKITKKRVGFLHYKYVYPLKFEKLLQFSTRKVKIVLIENNQTNGFGNLIKAEANISISNTLNKYDGRPFFVDDILEYLKQ